MRRLRPGFANPGSGGWANVVRPVLRRGRMCDDAIRGGSGRGVCLATGILQRFPERRPGEFRDTGAPGQDLGGANDPVSGERQVRTEIAAAWDAERLLLKNDRAFGVPRPLDNSAL